jgi:hypothetical protein
MIRLRSRSVVLTTAALAALGVASCETPPEAPPAPVAVVAPPPPPPPPVTIAPRVVELAGAFENYMEQAGGLAPTFENGEAVHRSLTAAAAYEPRQLASGAVAYAAVQALQDTAFVESVRQYARNPEQRATIAGNLIKDPAYAIGIPNSAGAAGRIAAGLDGHGARVRTAGMAVKQAAYSVQRQAWSKATIPNREQRLANVKTLGMALGAAPSPTLERIRSQALGHTTSALPATAMQPPYTPVVVRGLAVAALSALGLGDDPAYTETFNTLLNEPTGGYCLNLSKLNLNQCLAVSKPWYEDVFCLGQHIMIDTGQCIVNAAGAPPPAIAAVAAPVTSVTAEAAASGARDTTAVPAVAPAKAAAAATTTGGYKTTGPTKRP